MKQVIAYLRSEPALAAAAVLAVTQAIALPDTWQKVVLALMSLAAGTAVRQVVTPVAKIQG